jgi:hypothetical protein
MGLPNPPSIPAFDAVSAFVMTKTLGSSNPRLLTAGFPKTNISQDKVIHVHCPSKRADPVHQQAKRE